MPTKWVSKRTKRAQKDLRRSPLCRPRILCGIFLWQWLLRGHWLFPCSWLFSGTLANVGIPVFPGSLAIPGSLAVRKTFGITINCDRCQRWGLVRIRWPSNFGYIHDAANSLLQKAPFSYKTRIKSSFYCSKTPKAGKRSFFSALSPNIRGLGHISWDRTMESWTFRVIPIPLSTYSIIGSW